MIRKASLIATFSLLIIALAWGGVTLAQTGGGYDLSWWTVDGGSGSVNGGGYHLSGTTGQPDTGILTGGGYHLTSGYWSGGNGGNSPTSKTLYMPIMLRNH